MGAVREQKQSDEEGEIMEHLALFLCLLNESLELSRRQELSQDKALALLDHFFLFVFIFLICFAPQQQQHFPNMIIVFGAGVDVILLMVLAINTISD